MSLLNKSHNNKEKPQSLEESFPKRKTLSIESEAAWPAKSLQIQINLSTQHVVGNRVILKERVQWLVVSSSTGKIRYGDTRVTSGGTFDSVENRCDIKPQRNKQNMNEEISLLES